MNLAENLFELYFTNQISLENFIKKIGVFENGFLEDLLGQIDEAIKLKNVLRLEHLIYSLCLWNDCIKEKKTPGLELFLNKLNELLVADWHHSHEDIILLLQKISSVESLQYLYDAIELRPQYLVWDNNYAFEVKCIRALYYIGREKSFSYLERLCKHSNEVIRDMAQRQIKKMM